MYFQSYLHTQAHLFLKRQLHIFNNLRLTDFIRKQNSRSASVIPVYHRLHMIYLRTCSTVINATCNIQCARLKKTANINDKFATHIKHDCFIKAKMLSFELLFLFSPCCSVQQSDASASHYVKLLYFECTSHIYIWLYL